jgi:GAF domain-containing protein
MSSAQVAERRVAQAAVDHVALMLEAPWSCLWRVGTDTSLQLVARQAQTARSPVVLRLPIDCLAGTVTWKGLVNVADASEDPLWARQEFTRATGLRAYVGARLSYDGTVLGVLESMRPEPQLFSPREVRLVTGLATMTGWGLGVIRRLAYAEETLPRIINALTLAVGYTDLVSSDILLTLEQRCLAEQSRNAAMEVAQLVEDMISWQIGPAPAFVT